MDTYKNIHIGSHLKRVSDLRELSIDRACKFLQCDVLEIESMYMKESIDSHLLLKWCKLLNYNFFMIYHSHLQVYSPASSSTKIVIDKIGVKEHTFRKNIYSPELVDWILELLDSKTMTIKQVMSRYNIPRTTLYRWKKKGNSVVRQKSFDTNTQSLKYKLLYIDFIINSKYLNPDIKPKLISIIENEVNFDSNEVIKMNKLIKGNVNYIIAESRYKYLKNYDEDYARFVLNFQDQNKLSTSEVSKLFDLSRNTIASWRKRGVK